VIAERRARLGRDALAVDAAVEEAAAVAGIHFRCSRVGVRLAFGRVEARVGGRSAVARCVPSRCRVFDSAGIRRNDRVGRVGGGAPEKERRGERGGGNRKAHEARA
jgi:hypothetical protein